MRISQRDEQFDAHVYARKQALMWSTQNLPTQLIEGARDPKRSDGVWQAGCLTEHEVPVILLYQRELSLRRHYLPR